MANSSDQITQTAFYKAIQDKIGYHFRDLDLLREALTHKSAEISVKGHYERLEFLGDRVLGLVISDALFHHFNTEDQGELTKRFHALVQQNALAKIAVMLELSQLIITDATKQAAKQPSVLSDVIEALIAAIYLDGGYENAQRFILRYLDVTKTSSDDGEANPKSALQEWAMARKLPLPTYQLVAKSGPPHAPHFTVKAQIADGQEVTAQGASKKEAEQHAARALLRLLQKKESA